MNDTIDRLVAGIAPDPGPGTTALSGELMQEITALPRSPRRRARGRRRRWIAAPVLAAAMAAVTFGVTQAPAAAALDIKQVDGYYVITVKDLMADPGVYESELKARGLDITLSVTPTSRSLSGSLLVMSPDALGSGAPVAAEGAITSINAPGPCTRFGGCPVGVKVPVGYDRKAEIVLGRQARPGEKYALPPGVAMPGEPLHCVKYVDRSVAEVRTILRERGVEAAYTSPGKEAAPTAPDDWYVHDGVMSEAGKALLLVGPGRSGKPQPADPSCGSGS